MKRTKAHIVKECIAKVTGIGWCGRYKNGEKRLGWLLSPFIEPRCPMGLSSEQRKSLAGHQDYAQSKFYRVRVTIEPLLDKRGNYIVRLPKRNENS